MIKYIILIILAILPTVLISTYVYKKDKHKEPTATLITFFCLGILSACAVIVFSQLLDILIPMFAKEKYRMSILELIISSVIGVGLIEEVSKWIAVYFVGYRNKEFDETYDIIIYSIFTALGFATFENILYIINQSSVEVAVQRAIFSVPGHIAFAIFMSYYLCIAKINRIKAEYQEERVNIIKSIIFPTLIHGVFDFCLFTNEPIFIVIFYMFTGIIFLMAFEKLKTTYKNNASIIDLKRTCPNCGSVCYGKRCFVCNTKLD